MWGPQKQLQQAMCNNCSCMVLELVSKSQCFWKWVSYQKTSYVLIRREYKRERVRRGGSCSFRIYGYKTLVHRKWKNGLSFKRTEEAARVSASRWCRRRSASFPVALRPVRHGGSRPLSAEGLHFYMFFEFCYGLCPAEEDETAAAPRRWYKVLPT